MRMSNFTSLAPLKDLQQCLHLIWGSTIINEDHLMPILGLLFRVLCEVEQGSLGDISSSCHASLYMIPNKSPAGTNIGVCALARTVISASAGLARTGACLCRKYRPF